MTELIGLRAKTYSYLIDGGSEDKKAKGTKGCFTKRKLKLKTIKTLYLEATQLNSNKAGLFEGSFFKGRAGSI